MSGNSKHSKNNLKIYVIIFFREFYVVDGRTIYFFIQLINHHTYIEVSSYLIKTPTMLRFSAIILH